MSQNSFYKLIIVIMGVVIIAQWMIISRQAHEGPKRPTRTEVSRRAVQRKRPPVRKAAPAPAVVPAIPPTPQETKGTIALVIDDWGYTNTNCSVLNSIRVPMTLAVLPNLPYSKQIAEYAHARNLEVILHLPMEPKEKIRLERNTILVSMSKNKIADITRADIRAIPYLKGVSNHMGSQVTEHQGSMESVFSVLKDNKLYFLDSYVSGQSICRALARADGIPFASRDIFLDNKDDAAYIRQQIEQLKNKAQANGQAIGIGHDRSLTIKVLAEAVPELVQEGFRFVYVSELTQ